MKRILDRFDNSPLWIRLVTVLSLSFILVAGLYTVKKNTAAQVTTEVQPAKKTGSLPVKKETKEEKEKKEEKKNTEIYWDDVALFRYPDEYQLSIKEMHDGDILEIDSLDELCSIDPSYLNYREN